MLVVHRLHARALKILELLEACQCRQKERHRIDQACAPYDAGREEGREGGRAQEKAKFDIRSASTHMKCVMDHRRRGCGTLLVCVTSRMALAAAKTKVCEFCCRQGIKKPTTATWLLVTSKHPRTYVNKDRWHCKQVFMDASVSRMA